MSLREVLKNAQSILNKEGAVPPVPAAQATGGASATDVAAKTMGAVTEKLNALMQDMQAANGAMPPNMGAEIATCLAALKTLAPQQAPGAPAPGMAGAGAPPAMKNDVAKAELDAYTALNVTLGAISERMWCLRDLMREKKLPEAKGEMAAVSAMMANAGSLIEEVSAPAPAAEAPSAAEAGNFAAPTKSVSLMMTEMGLAKYVTDQIARAAEDTPAIAQKRLAHLATVTAVAKAGFEQAGDEPIAIEVTMETVFAPLAGGGWKKEPGLTANEDQTVKDLSLGAVPEAGDFDGSSVAKPAKAAKRFADVHELLKAQLADGSDFAPSEESRLAKNADGTSVEDDAWPMDLNAPLLSAEEVAKSHVSFDRSELPFGADFHS